MSSMQPLAPVEEGMRSSGIVEVQEGPGLLRFAALGAGCASLWATIWHIADIFSFLSHPLFFVLYVFMACLALVTMLFEAPADWYKRWIKITELYDMLIHRTAFLTLLVGRGLFYIFQATLWASRIQSTTEIFAVVAAASLFVVGVLHIVAHFGIMPHNVVERATAVSSGFPDLRLSAPPRE